MKANELMIDDFVAIGGKNMQIAALGTKKAGFVDGKGDMFYHNYEVIDAIPLTAEILKKNFFEEGATNGRNIFYWENTNHTLTVLQTDNHWRILIDFETIVREPDTYEINYFHELQHALKLSRTFIYLEP